MNQKAGLKAMGGATRQVTRQVTWRATRVLSCLLVVSIIATLVLAGCSTARNRYKAKPVRSLLKYRDREAASLLNRTHRSGNLYINFRPVLEIDAVLLDKDLRNAIVDRYVSKFLLSESQGAALRSEQVNAFDNRIDILVFVYEGNNKVTNFTNVDAPWRILLKNDEGELHSPTEVQRLERTHPQYQLLEDNFTVIDRWTQAYLMTFPKLSKGILNLQLGEQPFELIFTGIKGVVKLRWDDLALFYNLKLPNSRA